MGIGLLAVYLPWSPSALLWPQEWAMVISWTALGILVWQLRRKATSNADG